MKKFLSIAIILLGTLSWSYSAAEAATILFPGGGGTGWGYPGGIQAHTVVIGNGVNPMSTTSPSTAGYVLTSNGVNADPTFQPTGGTGSVYAFPLQLGGMNATSSPVGFSGGILVTASSTFTTVPSLGSLSGVVSGNLGVLYSSSTSTPTAGTGISISGTGSVIGSLTITNSAPDQTVVLTSGTGISTSGTYPNFTIANTGVLSLAQTYGTAQTGALTIGTSTATSFNGLTISNAITNVGGAFTFAPNTITGTLNSAGLTATGVTTGTYGTATTTPQITVNAQGQITSVLSMPMALPGSKQYNAYATQATSSPAYLNMNPTASSTSSTLSYVLSSSPYTVQNWITPVGEPGTNIIPGGAWIVDLTAWRSSGSASITLAMQFWEVSSSGADIALIDTTNSTTNLTNTKAQYTVIVTHGSYTMSSASSRIVMRLIATTSGTPTLSIAMGNGDSFDLITPGPTIVQYIASIGPTGQLQIGPDVTLSTTTSATNGLTSALTITGTGNVINFTPSLSGTLTVPGGGTGSTTMSGILVGNGTSAVKTLLIGSGLSFDGSTLSASGGGITSIGPAGQLQTGATQTISTSTTAYNGLSSILTVTASSNVQTFAMTMSGTLGIGGGGTNATSFGTTNGLVAYNGTSLVNYAGYTLISSLFSATNASTTQLTTGTNTFYVDPTGHTTCKDTVNGWSGACVPTRNPSWGPVSTTTPWTATTSAALGQSTPAPYAGTIRDAYCTTDVGTLNVDIAIGTTHLPLIVGASTTPGVIPFSSNNTFTKGQIIHFLAGTPASSPTVIGCTLDVTITP